MTQFQQNVNIDMNNPSSIYDSDMTFLTAPTKWNDRKKGARACLCFIYFFDLFFFFFLTWSLAHCCCIIYCLSVLSFPLVTPSICGFRYIDRLIYAIISTLLLSLLYMIPPIPFLLYYLGIFYNHIEGILYSHQCNRRKYVTAAKAL